MDIETHEKAGRLVAMIRDLKEEIAIWQKGFVQLAQKDQWRPEYDAIRRFNSRVASAHWPAFASQCVADLESRLAAAEQEFAAL